MPPRQNPYSHRIKLHRNLPRQPPPQRTRGSSKFFYTYLWRSRNRNDAEVEGCITFPRPV